MKEAAAKKVMKTASKVVSKPDPKKRILQKAWRVMKAMKTVEATTMKNVKDQGKVAAAERINYSNVAKALKRELGKVGGLDEVT